MSYLAVFERLQKETKCSVMMELTMLLQYSIALLWFEYNK